jgi:signal transduction histidine kinase
MSIAATNHDRDATPFSQLLARYERIIEISQQLNSTLDQSSLLRKIIMASIELTNTEAASILLIDPATGELRFELASNIKANDMEKISVPLEGSIAGWVVTHGEARVIEDVTQEPQHFKRMDDTIQFRTRNLLAVPLRTHNKVIGTLEAVNKLNDERFNDDDIKILTTLAGQAAIAIENTRLFQQSDFMAEMVHELRTPLAALKTSTTLLLRPDLPEERRAEMIHTMQSETERLIRMTSEFLDLSRWESGRARLDLAPFELNRLFAECIDVVTSQANDRSISIQMNAEPYIVNGDRGKVKQVLLNLLTNAIKYNRDNGQIMIEARPTTSEGEPFVQIAIADTGNGISKEAQKHMFQKFYRVADTAGYTQGTGLGLAITKHIVEAHSGAIWLESEKDQGSTFYLTLPMVV